MPQQRAPRRPKLGPNVWVVRHGPKYSIVEEGVPTYLVPPITQRLAITIARLIARANRSELIIQGRTTRIRARDSHGSDPFPPRG
ncbi:MAG: DUF2188 domain-containing protein [Gemmatimonadaceae bacterium]